MTYLQEDTDALVCILAGGIALVCPTFVQVVFLVFLVFLYFAHRDSEKKVPVRS